MTPEVSDRLIEYRLAQLDKAISKLSDAAASMAQTIARMESQSGVIDKRFERIEARLDETRKNVSQVIVGVATIVLAAVVTAILVRAGAL